MKTRNQIGQNLFELAETKAANEEGFTPSEVRDTTTSASKRTWSPIEVWRTRVKPAEQLNRSET